MQYLGPRDITVTLISLTSALQVQLNSTMQTGTVNTEGDTPIAGNDAKILHLSGLQTPPCSCVHTFL